MDNPIFNPNDYKPTNDIDLEALDDRYVNTEGDTVNHLNISSIQLYQSSTISFADNTVQSTAFNEDVVNEIYSNVNEMISTSNNGLNNNNTFTGINTFDDETLFKNQVKIYDINNSGDYTALYQNNSNVFNIQNNNSSGTINFFIGSNRMAVINQWHLNMLNKPIANVSSLSFTNGTSQTTAFTTTITDNLQTQINNLNTKTSSFTYDQAPTDKLTFNTNQIEFKGNVLFTGTHNIPTTDLTKVNNDILALQHKTNGMDQYAWSNAIQYSKKMSITAPLGTGDSGAHIQLINNHSTWVDAGSTCHALWFAGCPAGFWSAMTKNRDTVYLNREPSFGANNGTGGFVFTTHANIKRGLRIDCAGGISELHCGEFEVNANLKVNGTTTLIGNTTITGNTTSTGNTTITGSINVSGDITGNRVFAGGYNVKQFLDSHHTDITNLKNDKNKLTADLNCQNNGITSLRDITFSNYATITTSSTNMMLYAGVNKNAIIRNGQAGVARDLTISFDSVDFGGRTLLNTSGGGSQYGSFPDVYVTSTSSFTVISCSTTSQGANLADVSSGHISFNAGGVYRVTIGFSTKATQGNSGGAVDLYIRTRSQTGVQSPALTSLYSHTFTGNSNTDDGFISDYTSNDLNPMILDHNDNYEFRCKTKSKSNGVVRPNRFSLSYTALFSSQQELRLTMMGSNVWTLSQCNYLIERVA
jgi:hypothetical protein